MKLAEKIFILLVTIGITMKSMLILGGSILIVSGLLLLTLMYQFLSFAYFNDISLRNIFKKQSYQGISAMRIIGTIVLGFVLSNAVLGILFKIQSYPGARFFLCTGIILLLACLIVVLVRYSKNKPAGYKIILNRIIVLGCFSILLFITPSIFFIKIFHRDNPEYVQAVKNLQNDPDNEELQEEVERLREQPKH